MDELPHRRCNPGRIGTGTSERIVSLETRERGEDASQFILIFDAAPASCRQSEQGSSHRGDTALVAIRSAFECGVEDRHASQAADDGSLALPELGERRNHAIQHRLRIGQLECFPESLCNARFAGDVIVEGLEEPHSGPELVVDGGSRYSGSPGDALEAERRETITRHEDATRRRQEPGASLIRLSLSAAQPVLSGRVGLRRPHFGYTICKPKIAGEDVVEGLGRRPPGARPP